jgi:hypothetical protein
MPLSLLAVCGNAQEVCVIVNASVFELSTANREAARECQSLRDFGLGFLGELSPSPLCA